MEDCEFVTLCTCNDHEEPVHLMVRFTETDTRLSGSLLWTDRSRPRQQRFNERQLLQRLWGKSPCIFTSHTTRPIMRSHNSQSRNLRISLGI